MIRAVTRHAPAVVITISASGYYTDYILELVNSSGNTIETFSTADLREFGIEDAIDILSSMHVTARRTALRTDEAIDDILDVLDKAGDIE